MGTPSPSLMHCLGWLAAIWAASVAALGILAYAIRLAIL